MVCISQVTVPPVESAGNGMAQSNEAVTLSVFLRDYLRFRSYFTCVHVHRHIDFKFPHTVTCDFLYVRALFVHEGYDIVLMFR